MKPLSLSRPQVIMMVGLPGAGKSFFSRQFAETFGAPLVSYDRIRFELFTNPQFTNDEQEIITRVAVYQTEELLKTGRTILVDGGCNSRVSRLKIEELARKFKYDTLTIWVQTDSPTCLTRATKRNAKKTDDKFNPSLSTDQFNKLAKQLTPPNKEDFMVISGKHTYATQARAVLKKLVSENPHQVTVEKPQPSEPPRPSGTTNITRRSVTIR